MQFLLHSEVVLNGVSQGLLTGDIDHLHRSTTEKLAESALLQASCDVPQSLSIDYDNSAQETSRTFQIAYYAGNKSALRQVDRMSISHSEDVRSQLHQVFLDTSSCGVSSYTVGGNLSLTETDGDIDDWDIARLNLQWSRF